MSQDLEAARPVKLRHITIGDSTDPGAVTVAGVPFAPDPEGLNGREGFQKGDLTRRVSDEGTATVTFPNANGRDGRRHLDRFRIVAAGESYRIGDEWIEAWEGDVGAGDLLGVLTPIAASRDRREVGLELADALAQLRQTREGSAGVWAHAPRDVLSFYSRVRQFDVADSFDDDEWTFSASEQTSDTGWRYVRASKPAGEGPVTIKPGASQLGTMALAVPAADTHGAARLEVVLDLPELATSESFMIGLADDPITAAHSIQSPLPGGGAAVDAVSKTLKHRVLGSPPPGRHRAAIEVRERWVWFYWDGRLIATLPRSGSATAGDDFAYQDIHIRLLAGSNDTALKIHSVTYRRLIPYLIQLGADRGPMRLAGTPAADGLDGRWYSDLDRPIERVLEPVAEPVGRRLEPQINFPDANPPAWRHPNVPSASPWSAMWTGAIYLADPANTQIRVASVGRCRVWIGETRWGEQVIDYWPATLSGGGFQTPAAVGGLDDEGGWYPIRIEFHSSGGSAGLILQTSEDAGATWQALGDTANGGAPLAPLGCFVGNLRRVSHYEAISDIARDFAVQYTVDPRSLESGEFPGHLRMGHHIGRVTDRIITDDEATGVQVETKAEGAVDVLTADAAGLADPASAAQLAAELVNFAGVQAGRHLAVSEEHEQLSELSTEQALLQRLDAMLTLRSSVWEQIDARPGRRRDMVDSFPLTGAMAELAWDPGDAARLHLDSVGVHDTTPRQAMGVTRDLRPDGVGLPVLRWRQRPRGVREFVRQLQRQALDPQRHYQGQLTIVSGSVALLNVRNVPASEAFWTSWASWARDAASLVRATVIVQELAGTTGTISINGTDTGKVVPAVGRYDVTPWVARVSGSQVWAQINNGATAYVIQLELTVRI